MARKSKAVTATKRKPPVATRTAVKRPIAKRVTRETRDPEISRVPYRALTLADVRITPDTAITISAVWACLRYLSQTVAVLPWHAMRMGDTGPETASKHPIDWLLWKRPNKEWSSFQFRETLTHWACRHGNGYAEIEPDQMDRPYALWPIHPERVDACRAEDNSVDAYGDPIRTGDLYYEVRQDNSGFGAGTVPLTAKRIFHIRGFGEGPVGVNVMHYAAESLGWAKAVQLFGAAFFGNGTNVSAVIVNKKPLKPEGLRKQRAEFDNLYKGIRKSHRTAHLDNDADIKTLGVDAQKAQLVEANGALISEVCRWFGVPPHKVMDLARATFSNIEHQAIEVVVDSIQPWVRRFEDEADYKLFGDVNRQNFYSKLNMRGLLRGDFKSQNDGLMVARQNGVINADEWREFLDLNNLPKGEGGDKYLMQSQYTTLEKIGEEPATLESSKPQPDENDTSSLDAILSLNDAVLQMEAVHG